MGRLPNGIAPPWKRVRLANESAATVERYYQHPSSVGIYHTLSLDGVTWRVHALSPNVPDRAFQAVDMAVDYALQSIVSS